MRKRPASVEAEIERLYEARFPRFLRVARAIVGDREQAVDAVQEAFASALANVATYRGTGDLEAWVWRIVVNAARKARRGALPHLVASADDVELPPALPELTPVVAALPERQRLAVFLRYYADLDYRSIAAALDVEVGTVSALLAKAHTSMRRAIEEVRSSA